MKKYKNITGALVLGLFLGVPFFLKTVAPALEAFPAVIYPDGAGLVDVRPDLLRFNRVELFGQSLESGREELIEPRPFLRPIPVPYLYGLVKSEFGQLEDRSVRIRFKYLPIPEQKWPRQGKSEREKAKARAWIRERLSSLGLKSDRLIIRSARVGIEPSTGNVVEREIRSEKIIGLD